MGRKRNSIVGGAPGSTASTTPTTDATTEIVGAGAVGDEKNLIGQEGVTSAADDKNGIDETNVITAIPGSSEEEEETDTTEETTNAATTEIVGAGAEETDVIDNGDFEVIKPFRDKLKAGVYYEVGQKISGLAEARIENLLARKLIKAV